MAVLLWNAGERVSKKGYYSTYECYYTYAYMLVDLALLALHTHTYTHLPSIMPMYSRLCTYGSLWAADRRQGPDPHRPPRSLSVRLRSDGPETGNAPDQKRSQMRGATHTANDCGLLTFILAQGLLLPKGRQNRTTCIAGAEAVGVAGSSAVTRADHGATVAVARSAPCPRLPPPHGRRRAHTTGPAAALRH